MNKEWEERIERKIKQWEDDLYVTADDLILDSGKLLDQEIRNTNPQYCGFETRKFVGKRIRKILEERIKELE